MKKIWVLGDAVVDLLPDGEGRLLQCPGGAPANVAVGIARLGGHSAFIGRVGDDPFGRFLRQTLIREKVEVEWMHLDPLHRTSTVVVDLDESGERSFTFMVRPSADLFLTHADLPSFQEGDWLHVCSIALSAQPSRTTTFQAMDAIKAAGGYVSFDPNIRPDLWQDDNELRECLMQAMRKADVVKLSVEELTFLSGLDELEPALALVVSQSQSPLVLVTKGKEGVVAWHNGTLTAYSAAPVVSVDTTGAGDAFVAGLLYGLVNHTGDLPAILTLAQRCGALATTSKGAMTALPYQHEL
ncbi:aminoimidazole riboside kinase [Lelliottia sp. V106_10]|uniref:aminoimidazole riboside kinase n=1 Tax=Lelliottia wanjuensis TaxID=3050585 RepID=UPI00254ECAFE|nr:MULTISPECIES: aminoimidazole riboside kinase [unclassified Lelliottia]MDK9357730.1 aminoimidazole riboside kinase [Lelliottia sp. V106_16]MDK9372778.1 aminoimidazole riboside kinase [Lelliottia sp. V106_10]MDK9599582.1 aminoimidazole riboside kinase [Lelliottia sp. V106_5]